ncbi:hypothetical protein PM082_017581 [Marasmius tenuissimus]|nr:hypothetical protein PM082_017581 [Marasmius tenuissimus]
MVQQIIQNCRECDGERLRASDPLISAGTLIEFECLEEPWSPRLDQYNNIPFSLVVKYTIKSGMLATTGIGSLCLDQISSTSSRRPRNAAIAIKEVHV